jgi:hypothetical protein
MTCQVHEGLKESEDLREHKGPKDHKAFSDPSDLKEQTAPKVSRAMRGLLVQWVLEDWEAPQEQWERGEQRVRRDLWARWVLLVRWVRWVRREIRGRYLIPRI